MTDAITPFAAIAERKIAFNELDVFKTFQDKANEVDHTFIDVDGNRIPVSASLWETGSAIFSIFQRIASGSITSMDQWRRLKQDVDVWMQEWFDIYLECYGFYGLQKEGQSVEKFSQFEVVTTATCNYTDLSRKKGMLPALCYLGMNRIQDMVRAELEGMSPNWIMDMSFEVASYHGIISGIDEEMNQISIG